MRELRVARAVMTDAAPIGELLAAAGARLAEQGFANWSRPYPPERIHQEIAAETMWVVTSREELVSSSTRIVATFTLRNQPIHAYDPAPWREPERRAWYLNRLAVDPREQGKGIGAVCLHEVAQQAVALDAAAVRCDVLASNERLCAFYERAGYEARGTRSHSGWTFACYERLLG